MKFQFESLSDFLWMAGHGGYVWACYGVTFTALLYLIFAPVVSRQKFVKLKKAEVKRKAAQAQNVSTVNAEQLSSEVSG